MRGARLLRALVRRDTAALGALARTLVLRAPVLRTLPDPSEPIVNDDAYRAWLGPAPTPPPPSATAAPFLSVIVFVKRPRPDRFAAMIGSVLAQAAPGAELVLVPVQPLAPAVARVVARHAADPRVRLCRRQWWPYATPFREALAACRGAFVTVIGPHDRLQADCAAQLAAMAGDADVLLADNDKLGVHGERRDPRLAGAWDPDAPLAGPPTGLVAIRTSRLAALRLRRRIGLRHAAWDLLLQAMAGLPPERARHVPAILLSRDTREPLPQPVAFTRLVAAHLRATGQAGCTATWDWPARAVRVRRALPAEPPLVSVIIPTRDRATLLRTCLEGLRHRTDYPNLEIIVLDNESREPDTHALLAELGADPRVRVVPVAGDFNWSRFNNHAVQVMRGEIAVLLNNDTDVIDSGWLRELVVQVLRPEIGAVGAKLLYPDGRIQHAGVVLGPHTSATHVWRYADGATPGYMGQLRRVRRASSVTGACVALRRAVFLEIGGLDADNLQVAWNDTDLCLKVQAAGYDVLWTPYALLYHIEQASRGSDEAPLARVRLAREREHMRGRWGAKLDGDPWFSPMLRVSDAGTRLAERDEVPEWLPKRY